MSRRGDDSLSEGSSRNDRRRRDDSRDDSRRGRRRRDDSPVDRRRNNRNDKRRRSTSSDRHYRRRRRSTSSSQRDYYGNWKRDPWENDNKKKSNTHHQNRRDEPAASHNNNNRRNPVPSSIPVPPGLNRSALQTLPEPDVHNNISNYTAAQMWVEKSQVDDARVASHRNRIKRSIECILSSEFVDRASIRSVDHLRHAIETNVQTSSDVESVVEALLDKMESDQGSATWLIVDLLAFDAAMKVFVLPNPRRDYLAPFFKGIDTFLRQYMPWDCKDADLLKRFFRVFETWRNFLPTEIKQLIETTKNLQ